MDTTLGHSRKLWLLTLVGLAIVSIAVFTLAHRSYWGPAQLLIVVSGAIVLTLLFLWRRDLVCNMIAHFLVDLAGFVAASAQS